MLLCLDRGAAAQVGLGSSVTQVTLVARAGARGLIQSTSEPRLAGSIGGWREASALLRVSANTAYRVIVKRVPGAGPRLWVQAAAGQFEELTPGSSVPLVRESQAAVDRDREVRFRIEMPAQAATPAVLPVRYELAIDPIL